MSTLLEQASLVMIPSGYKEDVVYSQIPTNGNGDLSFTRASNGTRINSAGLVEVCPWNLLQQSETFDNAYWRKNAVTITPNTINAPNGTLTADQISESTLSISHGVYPSSGTSIVVGQSYTASMYVKKGNRIYCGLEAFFNTTNGAIAFFNLDNGTLLYQFAQGSGYSVTNSSITNVGNDWYLLRATFTFGGIPAYVGVCIASTQWTTGTSYNNLYAGDTSKFIYAWGAQLNIGSTAKPYFPTTDRLNVPRLTYQNGGGGCPSLLLEPQRTNLSLWSEDFSNVVWLKLGGSSVTANTTTAPDGTTTADTLSLTTNASSSVAQSIVLATTTTITISVYAKVSSGTKDFRLRTDNPTTTQAFTATTSWQRFSMTATPTVTTSAYVINDLAGTAGDLIIWGFQVEAGEYPTSYIPTTSATATRVADAFTRDNIYTNGLISSSGGTWFIELANNVPLVRDASVSEFYIGESATSSIQTGSRSISVRNGGGGNSLLRVQYWDGSFISTLFITTSNTPKIAIKFNGTTADIFQNGVKVVAGASAALTLASVQHFNALAGVSRNLKQALLFPTPLTDAECIALTTI
jgi:hypothetical protein